MGIFDRIRTFLSSVFDSSRNTESRSTARVPPFNQNYGYSTRTSSTRSPSRSDSRYSAPNDFHRQWTMGDQSSTTTDRTSTPHSRNKEPRSTAREPPFNQNYGYSTYTSSTRLSSTSDSRYSAPNDFYRQRTTGSQSSSTTDRTPTPHSLKNLTFKVQSSPKDRSFTPRSDVVYLDQWTTCNATIVDVYGNEINTSGSVELRSTSCIEFRNAKLVNGRLNFSMKAAGGETTARLIITINKYSVSNTHVLFKDVVLSFLPCSSNLSETTMKQIDTTDQESSKCVFRVNIIDVFGDPAPINSQKNCKLETRLSHTESEDDADHIHVDKCICYGSNKLCFDLSVTSKRPWTKRVAVFLNGQQLEPAEEFEIPDEERRTILRTCSDASSDEYELSNFAFIPMPSFVVHRNSRAFIPVSPHVDEGQFVPFDDKMCQMTRIPETGECRMVCKTATKQTIMGPEFAHVNNIKRVLELKDRLQLVEGSNQTTIIFDHCGLSAISVCKAKELVLHLLRGSYYRKKASEAARVRMEWKTRFENLDEIVSSTLRESPTLKFCKYFKDYYGNLMNKYNREACEEIFFFFNYNRDESEVDLHGLLVADENRLESLRLDLLRGNLDDEEINDIIRRCRLKSSRGRKLNVLKKELMAGRLPAHEVHEFIESCEIRNCTNEQELENLRRDLLRRCDRNKEVDTIIEKWRSESDEAIRKLRQTLENFDLERAMEDKSPWIEIIVGAGHHSRNEKQNIRPKVEKFLKERGDRFTEVNKGSLVVTFMEYSGPEPCFGEYYCTTCDRCWKSSKSYKGKYQKCSRCHRECWPVKQRAKEKVLNYTRDGKEEKRKSKPHQSHLCQRCTELGYPCNEEDYYSDYD